MTDLIKHRLLAQSRAPNTNAYSVFAKSISRNICVKSITVCNSDANAVAFSIFANTAGTTLDSTCALYSACVLNARTTSILEWQDGMHFKGGVAGTLGVQANVANVVCFTVCGAEF